MTNQQYLEVKIQSPKAILYQGKALSVSSKNSLGNFDILPLHANFITIIQNEPILLVSETNAKLNFNFKEAILLHTSGKVTIYADLQYAAL